MITLVLTRPLCASLLIATIGICVAAAARGDSAEPSRQTRPAKIAELAADLGFEAELRHIDAAAPDLTALVAPHDPAWNPSNPHWEAVNALVRRDLHDDAAATFAEQSAAIMDRATHALSETLTESDIDESLAFFHSPVGRHYLELQDALTAINVGSGVDNDAAQGPGAVDNLDAREKLLETSLPLAVVHALYPPAVYDRLLAVMYSKLSKRHGAELDALAQRYAGEIPQFESFLDSPAFARITAAEKAAARNMPTPDLASFFATERSTHGAQWAAAYAAAGRVSVMRGGADQ